MDLKQKIELKKLHDYNICRLEIHYSGGGDDGCIDDEDDDCDDSDDAHDVKDDGDEESDGDDEVDVYSFY